MRFEINPDLKEKVNVDFMIWSRDNVEKQQGAKTLSSGRITEAPEGFHGSLNGRENTLLGKWCHMEPRMGHNSGCRGHLGYWDSDSRKNRYQNTEG